MRDVEEESRKLKKIVADLSLDLHGLKEIIRKALSAVQKRDMVTFLQQDLTFSERCARRTVEIDRKTMHYEPVEKDSPELIKQFRVIAEW